MIDIQLKTEKFTLHCSKILILLFQDYNNPNTLLAIFIYIKTQLT